MRAFVIVPVLALCGCTQAINDEFATAAQERQRSAVVIQKLSFVVEDLSVKAGDIRGEVLAGQCADSAARLADDAAESFDRNNKPPAFDMVGIVKDISTGNYGGLALGLMTAAGTAFAARKKIKRLVQKGREFAGEEPNVAVEKAAQDRDFRV